MLTIAIELAVDRAGLGRDRDEVPRALPGDRPRDAPLRLARTSSLWDDERRVLLRRARAPRRHGRSGCAVRSMVGLLPVLAVAHAPVGTAPTRCPTSPRGCAGCRPRRPDLLDGLLTRPGRSASRPTTCSRCSTPTGCAACCERMFDEDEFLSPYGIRSLSAAYRTPYTADVDGQHTVDRLRARRIAHGPVRRQLELARAGLVPGQRAARRRAAHLRHVPRRPTHVEVPTGSGPALTLAQRGRPASTTGWCALFRVGPTGARPCDGARIEASDNPLWREHVTFSEYFDGDTGEGLGATHQTGWTALVAHLLCRPATERRHRMADIEQLEHPRDLPQPVAVSLREDEISLRRRLARPVHRRRQARLRRRHPLHRRRALAGAAVPLRVGTARLGVPAGRLAGRAQRRRAEERRASPSWREETGLRADSTACTSAGSISAPGYRHATAFDVVPRDRAARGRRRAARPPRPTWSTA